MNLKYAMRSEDTEQINVIAWAMWEKSRYPELKLLHHIPNGGSRNKAEAVKLKQMGVRAGVPDLHLPVPKGRYCGLYIEMKYETGRLQESQKEFLKAAAGYRNYCAVCYGSEEAISVLKEYVTLEDGESMNAPNTSIYRNGKIKAI